MCGEHNAIAANSLNQSGSSPHVRGALQAGLGHHVGRGIIPACAGSTLALPLPGWSVRDHPRMCGEHLAMASSMLRPSGSSPHVRGARSVFSGSCRLNGIIPACAGSTVTNSCEAVLTWDHPRMCGEHKTTKTGKQILQGSSPHVRGAHRFLIHHDIVDGIIPACAGSTSRC